MAHIEIVIKTHVCFRHHFLKRKGSQLFADCPISARTLASTLALTSLVHWASENEKLGGAEAFATVASVDVKAAPSRGSHISRR